MEFIIKSIAGRELYKCDAASLRDAVVKAVAARADLQGADLRGAYLRGAYLQGAYLQGADLQGADLQRAYLQGAYLRGADLRGAYLQGAYLRGADLRGADLQGADLTDIRDDFRKVLDAAPNEALGLRAALRRGNVDGSTYEGECACLVSTIAKVRACPYRDLVGLKPDANRPAERWFIAIRPGDNARNNQVVAITLGWLDEWLKEKGIKIPRRPKAIGEVARAMSIMTKRQRAALLRHVRSMTVTP